MDGALIIDKPAGRTSHDIVAIARRALGTRQIGHAGTLDPLATGVLVLLAGRATRLSQFIVHDEKEYLADVRLGMTSPTYDSEGVAGRTGWQIPSDETVRKLDDVLSGFRGTFEQTPPQFSAKKIAGRPAYEHARKDRAVELKPVQVTVRELERLPSNDAALVRLRLVVSAGFYVRSLAHDIGQELGCGAYLESLRRTRSGRFSLEDAVPIETLIAGTATLLPLNTLVEDLPAVTVSDDGLRLVSHGNPVGARHITGGALEGGTERRIRLLAPAGALVAIGRRDADGLLHPQVVLV